LFDLLKNNSHQFFKLTRQLNNEEPPLENLLPAPGCLFPLFGGNKQLTELVFTQHIIPVFFRDIVPVWGSPWAGPSIFVGVWSIWPVRGKAVNKNPPAFPISLRGRNNCSSIVPRKRCTTLASLIVKHPHPWGLFLRFFHTCLSPSPRICQIPAAWEAGYNQVENLKQKMTQSQILDHPSPITNNK